MIIATRLFIASFLFHISPRDVVPQTQKRFHSLMAVDLIG